MALTAEKPGLLERLGGAMGSSDLSPRPEQIGSVDLIAALAFIQTNSRAEQHGEIEGPPPIDPRTELASALIRCKYAGDRSAEPRAFALLVRWIQHQRAFSRWKVRPGARDEITRRFVRQGLAEWLHQVCNVCHGRKMLGLDRGEVVEKRVRCRRCAGRGRVHETPRGSKLGVALVRDCLACGGKGALTGRRLRQSKLEQCQQCLGVGQRRASDAERAIAIGVDAKAIDRYWARRFSWLAASLDRIDMLAKSCLHSQFKSDIKRS